MSTGYLQQYLLSLLILLICIFPIFLVSKLEAYQFYRSESIFNALKMVILETFTY